MERIIDVASYLFTEYKKMSGDTIDEMKLHKLLYFAQRESLALTNEPLFSGEFEGWVYGPVSREIRYAYTKDGIAASTKPISAESAYIANNVLMQYGVFATWKLSELSHKELSWRNARKGLSDGDCGSKTLELEDIRRDAEKVRPYDAVWDMYYDEFEDMEACE